MSDLIAYRYFEKFMFRMPLDGVLDFSQAKDLETTKKIIKDFIDSDHFAEFGFELSVNNSWTKLRKQARYDDAFKSLYPTIKTWGKFRFYINNYEMLIKLRNDIGLRGKRIELRNSDGGDQ